MSPTSSPVAAFAQLHIDTTYPSPTTARVRVVGEVDLATSSVLRGRLLAALTAERLAVLDIDLGGVTFLDCTGINALVAVRNAAVHTGSQIRVNDPQPIVRQILDLTGLLGVLTAPLDQPPPLRTGSKCPPRTGPTRANLTQPPDLMVAA
jgi:anti-anti-sigma factor